MDTFINMVQGDSSPSRIFSFTRQDGTIPDLTGATSIDFVIYRPDLDTQTNSGHTACSLVGLGSAGKVQYAWNVIDLPIAGVYRCLLRITFSSGVIETNVVYVTVESNTV